MVEGINTNDEKICGVLVAYSDDENIDGVKYRVAIRKNLCDGFELRQYANKTVKPIKK